MNLIKRLFFFIVLITSLTCYSQDDFNFILKYDQGYFIKNSGEKIECFIEDKGNKMIDFHPSKLKYKFDANDKSKFIKYEDIKEYKMLGQIFEAIYYDNSRMMLERNIKGNISLYSIDVKSNQSWTTPQGTTSGGFTRETTIYYIKKDEFVEKVPRLGFKEFMLKYIDDNEKLAKDIIDKKLKYDNLYTIISRYNR